MMRKEIAIISMYLALITVLGVKLIWAVAFQTENCKPALVNNQPSRVQLANIVITTSVSRVLDALKMPRNREQT